MNKTVTQDQALDLRTQIATYISQRTGETIHTEGATLRISMTDPQPCSVILTVAPSNTSSMSDGVIVELVDDPDGEAECSHKTVKSVEAAINFLSGYKSLRHLKADS